MASPSLASPMAPSRSGPGNQEGDDQSHTPKDQQETEVDHSDERVPKLGMKFLSEEEAYLFYNNYAKTIGFSIRRSSGHKVTNSSTIQQRTFTCLRQGHRREDKREETFSYSRPKTRCGCDARMKISLRNGFYYVYECDARMKISLRNKGALGPLTLV